MLSRRSIRLTLSSTLIFVTGLALAADPADLERLRETSACPKCDLSGADLSSMRLMSADLSGADLRGAKLRKTILFRANLTGADLRLLQCRPAGGTIRPWRFFAYSRSRPRTTCPTCRRGTSAGACMATHSVSRFAWRARSAPKAAG